MAQAGFKPKPSGSWPPAAHEKRLEKGELCAGYLNIVPVSRK